MSIVVVDVVLWVSVVVVVVVQLWPLGFVGSGLIVVGGFFFRLLLVFLLLVATAYLGGCPITSLDALGGHSMILCPSKSRSVVVVLCDFVHLLVVDSGGGGGGFQSRRTSQVSRNMKCLSLEAFKTSVLSIDLCSFLTDSFDFDGLYAMYEFFFTVGESYSIIISSLNYR
ncbi:hypothetical protein CFP56_014294 [Quercus suber]|uniref:NADH dehydrogenase subunit 6 n=1 Tax=Quercus suber TaxID=58331 RepID=A0AAW0KRE5_QUESU